MFFFITLKPILRSYHCDRRCGKPDPYFLPVATPEQGPISITDGHAKNCETVDRKLHTVEKARVRSEFRGAVRSPRRAAPDIGRRFGFLGSRPISFYDFVLIFCYRGNFFEMMLNKLS
jgi:hypothetical protein